jgi:quercetin dioxygenase-like cupin family protein
MTSIKITYFKTVEKPHGRSVPLECRCTTSRLVVSPRRPSLFFCRMASGKILRISERFRKRRVRRKEVLLALDTDGIIGHADRIVGYAVPIGTPGRMRYARKGFWGSTGSVPEAVMIVQKADEVERIKIESLSYRQQSRAVKEVTVQWLSKFGEDAQGYPAYGLRLFTVGPDGEIPAHSHSYMQTMYFLSGRFECYRFDPETDEPTETRICGPGDAVYVPSMEPHGMKNLSSIEPGTFLCCICTLDSGRSL